jgi:glycosyltransferase involved in cell wall biosynthesis
VSQEPGPSVSVLIPAYNEAETIEQVLENVLALDIVL